MVRRFNPISTTKSRAQPPLSPHVDAKDGGNDSTKENLSRGSTDACTVVWWAGFRKLTLYPLYTSERIVTIVGESGTGKTHLMLQTLFDRIVDSGEEVIYCDMSYTFNHFCLAQQIVLALNIQSMHSNILDELKPHLEDEWGLHRF